ncbi:hypothetical protein KR044_003541 [Drosophila immigrans]|nr:hypothetical protein KR044_003541 [Drosophila immigrans]
MICWGENNSCGIFIDQVASDRCDCLRDFCIRDYAPEQRIMVQRFQLDEVIDHAYGKNEEHLSELGSLLRIKSIPRSIKYDAENKQAMNRLAQRLIELNFEVEIVDVKPKEEDQPSHYMIFANYFSTPTKNVMLIYGHIDVPPVELSDAWLHPPFDLTEKDEKLFGRGLTSSKGPLLCWIQAIDAWMTRFKDLPVNVRFVIDSNSTGDPHALREVLESHRDFFRPVDVLVCCTNLWIAEHVPMLTTCHSGYVLFELDVRAEAPKEPTECPPQPCSCGIRRDPMSDLLLLMNSLSNTEQGALVKGLDRHVMPVTQHDWDIFHQVELGIQEFKRQTGASALPHEQSHPEFLKHRWCMPSLTLHSVNCHNVLSMRDFHTPAHISARFSVKLVPDQGVQHVRYVVRSHLDEAYVRLKCKNPATLRVVDQLAPSMESRTASYNQAASRAFKSTYSVTAAIPDTVNVCMPVVNELRRVCMESIQVVGIPFCSIHTQPNDANESCTKEEYQRNLELFATFLFEVAHIPAECKCTEIRDFCYEKGQATETDFIRMMEPRSHKTHVLYEINELEIDRTVDKDVVLPTVEHILLGKKPSLPPKT